MGAQTTRTHAIPEEEAGPLAAMAPAAHLLPFPSLDKVTEGEEAGKSGCSGGNLLLKLEETPATTLQKLGVPRYKLPLWYAVVGFIYMSYAEQHLTISGRAVLESNTFAPFRLLLPEVLISVDHMVGLVL